MYFWKIDNLKKELVAGTLSERESFKYLMANTIFISLVLIPFPSNNSFDIGSAIVGVPIAIFGIWYIYNANGGAQGSHLLQRYMAIGWVVLVRFFALAGIPVIVAYLITIGLMLEEIPEHTTVLDAVLYNILTLVYIYWFAHHVRMVARERSV